jgi:hypothetical protein
MKNLVILIVFCLAMCSFAFAQTSFPELDKVKKIKLLESTREDVKRVFDTDKEKSDDDKYITENMYIYFYYSNGDCSDEVEEWNVSEGKVIEIHVIFKDAEKPQTLKIDLSKLDRIKTDEEDEEDDVYTYYDKQKGVNYFVYKGKIGSIKLIPSEKNSPALCNNDNFRQFNLDSKWFRNKLQDRPLATTGELDSYVNVKDLILSRSEVILGCAASASTKSEIKSGNAEIAVKTKSTADESDDDLLYEYKISAGKINGSGANVTWDLSGVEPGKYTITVSIDNGGCKVCGTTRTETVEVKDRPDCSLKKVDSQPENLRPVNSEVKKEKSPDQ